MDTKETSPRLESLKAQISIERRKVKINKLNDEIKELEFFIASMEKYPC